MTKRQQIENTLIAAFKGMHHAGKVKWGHDGNPEDPWATTCVLPMATYDSDTLTRLVLAAHAYAVRIEIGPGGPRQVKLKLWTRDRSADWYEGHPTIQQSIDRIFLPDHFTG
jgi:hypothetical protein